MTKPSQRNSETLESRSDSGNSMQRHDPGTMFIKSPNQQIKKERTMTESERIE